MFKILHTHMHMHMHMHTHICMQLLGRIQASISAFPGFRVLVRWRFGVTVCICVPHTSSSCLGFSQLWGSGGRDASAAQRNPAWTQQPCSTGSQFPSRRPLSSDFQCPSPSRALRVISSGGPDNSSRCLISALCHSWKSAFLTQRVSLRIPLGF